jgi:hypothetical protein
MKHITFLGHVGAVTALLATMSTPTQARPLVLQPTQVLTSPAPAYQDFGVVSMAMDGDWALITANNSPSPAPNLDYDDHALLYRRVNGQWVFDRVLLTDHVGGSSFEYTPPTVAMSNSLAAASFNPMRVFRRSGSTWTEISHPFTAPPRTRDWINGIVSWDGSTLVGNSGFSDTDCYGAVYATRGAGDVWTPLQFVSAGSCDLIVNRVAKSGNTLAFAAYPDSTESEVFSQVRTLRNGPAGWQFAFSINSRGDVVAARDPLVFVPHDGADGVSAYRSDSGDAHPDPDDRLAAPDYNYYTQSPSDNVVTTPNYVLASSFDRTDVFARNTAGRYAHVAVLRSNDYFSGYYFFPMAMSGRNVLLFSRHVEDNSRTAVLAFELPADLTTPAVQQHTFQSGTANGWAPTSGQFAVAQSGTNRIYRQSSLAGDARAVLTDSDWRDATITADIRPREFSGNDRWVGLATRYVDAFNFYYVTLRNSGTIQLRRNVNGVYSTLASQPLAVTAGRNYRVSLQSLGDTQNVYLDGKLLLSARDASLARGRAAVVGYRASADFDNVIVQPSMFFPIFDLDFPNSCSIHLPEYSVSGNGNWDCDPLGTTTRHIIQDSLAGDARVMVGTTTDDQTILARARATAFAAPSGASTERWFGLATRFQDTSNYYYLSLRNSNQVSLRKVVNGAITVLGSAPRPITAGTWYDLRLEAVGNQVRAYVNGTLAIQATDSTFATGKSGLLTFKSAAQFKGVRAYQP